MNAMSMRLSYNTNGWTLHPLEETIKKIAEYGYQGIDLLCDRPFAYPVDLGKEEIKQLRETLSGLGLEVANASANAVRVLRRTDEHWAEPSLANPDKKRRQERIRYTKQVVDLAAAIDAKEVSVTSGIFDGDPEELWPLFIDSLGECVDYGADTEMKIAIEPEPEMLVEFTDEALRAAEEIGSRWFGVQFDTSHALTKGEDIVESIRRVGNKLFHVHIVDSKGKKHFHRIPGTGEVDFKTVLDALNKVGYSGFLTVELYTYTHMAEKATRQSMEYLKRIV